MRSKSDEKGNLFLFPMSGSIDGSSSDSNWRNVDELHQHWKPQVEPFVAVDFETYFTTSYSLANMSAWEYVHHQAFDAYLVALEWWTGTEWKRWVGVPSKAPWNDLNGIIWTSHNAGFDELVFLRTRQLGDIKTRAYPKRWFCTADMAIYLQAGRNLKLAVHNLFKATISKEIRGAMQAGNASIEAVRDYAASDSFWCAKIWASYQHKWSECERTLSVVTRHQGWRGFYLASPQTEQAIAHLESVKNKLKHEIPWGRKGAVVSLKLFAAECGKHGIHAPMSLADDNESAVRWEAMHGARFPWIQQLKRYSKANQVQGSLQMMLERRRKDGTVPFTMMYCKATHTKRWQHADGIRMQNLDKDPVEGVHLRHHLVPRPGFVYVIADLSQIEPRVLNWRAGNHEFLKICSGGVSPYEAHARSSMGYSDPMPLKEGNPKIYALAKARVLALGYQSGAEQFKEMAFSMAGLDISLDDQTMLIGEHVVRMKQINSFLNNADQLTVELYRTGKFDVLPSAMTVVQDFRRTSTHIVNLWDERQKAVKARVGKHYISSIPNGSSIKYFDVKVTEQRRWSRDGKPYTTDDITAWVVKDSNNPKDRKHLYGGKIVENEVQWISREVFADCYYRASLIPDIFPLWSAHDEGIWEVPEAVAEQRLQDIHQIMKTAPWWAEGLPIDSSAEITTHYKK